MWPRVTSPPFFFFLSPLPKDGSRRDGHGTVHLCPLPVWRAGGQSERFSSSFALGVESRFQGSTFSGFASPENVTSRQGALSDVGTPLTTTVKLEACFDFVQQQTVNCC